MSVKSRISSALRSLHLLAAAEKARYYMQKAKFARVNRQFRRQHPGVVLPPPYFIYETYKLNFEEYYHDGFVTAREIVEAIQKHIHTNRSDFRILDWGCGPARITRHLPGLLPGADIHGSDYNRDYVQWNSRNLPGIQFSLNKLEPPLNYAAKFFDAVIGLSVFTHLSARNHERWISELARVLKTGGVAFITTQGEAFKSKLLESERKLFDSNKLVLREEIVEGNRLYSAFQPPALMRKIFEADFDILDFDPGKAGQHPAQDIWLIRRKG